VWSSHPVPVARAAELNAWVASGEYTRILAGDFPGRDGDGNASVTADVKAAASSYRESFSTSQDPLVSLVRRVGGGAADLGGWAGEQAGKARAWAGTAGSAAADAARRAANPTNPANGTDTPPPPATPPTPPPAG
jgi:hypothetical protein